MSKHPLVLNFRRISKIIQLLNPLPFDRNPFEQSFAFVLRIFRNPHRIGARVQQEEADKLRSYLALNKSSKCGRRKKLVIDPTLNRD
jgi:hypothetical protein